MPSRLDVDRQLAAEQSAGGAAVQRPCRLLLDVSSGLPAASPCALSPTARRGKPKLGELRHPKSTAPARRRRAKLAPATAPSSIGHLWIP